MLKAQILEFDRMIRAWHRSSETSRRLDDIPGVGPVLATALVASVADPMAFRSGRDFSAWIGSVTEAELEQQQSCLTLHRTRHLFIRQQTSVINAIRAHLTEFGIVAPVGRLSFELAATPSSWSTPWRWQGQAGQYQQTRRPLSAQPVHDRRAGAASATR